MLLLIGLVLCQAPLSFLSLLYHLFCIISFVSSLLFHLFCFFSGGLTIYVILILNHFTNLLYIPTACNLSVLPLSLWIIPHFLSRHRMYVYTYHNYSIYQTSFLPSPLLPPRDFTRPTGFTRRAITHSLVLWHIYPTVSYPLTRLPAQFSSNLPR